MKLLIKQRVFSWTDSYDIYDEYGNKKYFVKAEFLSLTHQLHVYDAYDREIGRISQRFFALTPAFDIEMEGRSVGQIRKQFTLFRPKYDVDYNEWHVEGDFWGWDYDVCEGNRTVVHISKELFHWGDTYVLNFADPADELMGLLLVIAIDAANCSDNK